MPKIVGKEDTFQYRIENNFAILPVHLIVVETLGLLEDKAFDAHSYVLSVYKRKLKVG
jgi:hypothetical protein